MEHEHAATNDKPKYPWRLATNERYRDVVKNIMTLSTAALLLPVFLMKEVFGVQGKTLREVAGWPMWASWSLLGVSILTGILFHYFSAKWVRQAWGQPAGILFCFPVSEEVIERALDATFWATTFCFLVGLMCITGFVYNLLGR
jgi:hypothetical protein